MIKKFLISLFLVFGAFAVQADLYLADSVAVQSDGDNPVLAKQSALEQGQRQSLAQVVRRLLGKNKEFFVADLPAADIVNLVQDVSIQNEKNTAQSYWATVQVRFQPEAVRNYLSSHNQNYLKSEVPSYLVIPVMMSGAKTIGLEDENNFYQFLKAQDKLSDFYQMSLPAGDLNEMVMVNRALQSGQYADLLSLANRYGANAILMVFATPKSAQNWRLSSKVYPENESQNVEIDDWYDSVSLENGWQRLLDKMEEGLRQSDLTGEDQKGIYYARLNENSLAMWAQDERAFRKLKFLKDLMLRGVYRHQILLSFSFAGSQEELAESWNKAGWRWQPDLTGPSGTLTRKEVYYE